MRTRYNHSPIHLAPIAALALAMACGSSTGPGEGKLPPLGAYDYEFRGALDQRDYVGAFTLTYATTDSIAGRFDVPGMQARADLGFRNGDAWVVYGFDNARIHALRLDWRGGRLTCDGRHLQPSPLVSISTTCALRKR